MDAPIAFKNDAKELQAMQETATAKVAEGHASADLERSPSDAAIENGRNLKDQLHEYDADDDDDGDDDDADVIIVKVKNGCENTRLSEHMGGSLHSRLEQVQIDAKSKPNVSLAKVRMEHENGEQGVKSEQKQQKQTAQGNNQNKLSAQTQPTEPVGSGQAYEHNKGIYGKSPAIGSPKASFAVHPMHTECMGLACDQLPTTASLASSITSPVVSSKLICTNAISHSHSSSNSNSSSSSSSSNSSTAQNDPPNQMFSHCTNTSLQQQRQLSFLKSQSLDLYNDNSTTMNEHNAYQNLLFSQLPEISEIRFSDAQPPQPRPQSQTQPLGLAQAQAQAQVQAHAQKQAQSQTTGQNTTSTAGDILSNSSLKNVDSGLALAHGHSVDGATADGGVRSVQRPSMTSRFQSLDSRPIYPNVPFSPYASPYGSPRTHRRPLRESRRISIEKTGSFLQLNQYKLMDQIGQGSYGLVKLAYSEEDSTHYAMKILSKRRLLRQAGLMRRGPKKTTSPLDRVYREIAVLKKLDHPNVVKLVEVLDDPVEDSLYMVFELVKQGEVLSIPTDKPLTEERSWSVFRDTLLGLEYLHYQRIIHADIKPGNLLLTECGRVKIADLGVCNEFLGEDATMTNGSTAGTPAFRAPETCVLGQNVYCGRAADIWALGATLYSLVFGKVPFIANSIPLLYEKIQNESLLFPSIPVISKELKHCIELMLDKEAGKRITLPQLKQNEWVTAYGRHPLPSEDENCRLVQVSDDDINSVVRSIPKLDTLILIKTMLKKHSFGNPFAKGISGRAPQRGGSRLERFVRAGRSNSAPGSYHMPIDRQLSGDIMLPALSELVPTAHNDEC